MNLTHANWAICLAVPKVCSYSTGHLGRCEHRPCTHRCQGGSGLQHACEAKGLWRTLVVQGALILPCTEELLQEGRVVDCARQEGHDLLLPHLCGLHSGGHLPHLMLMRLWIRPPFRCVSMMKVSQHWLKADVDLQPPPSQISDQLRQAQRQQGFT